jgi:cell division protein FtsL
MKKALSANNRSSKLVSVWIFLMILFLAELFLYTWCRVQWVGTGYEIDQAKKIQRHLNQRQHSLKVEIERLKSPRRIAKIAREKLHLDMPTPNQMMVFP